MSPSDRSTVPEPEVPPPAARIPFRPGRALRALRALLRDPDDTEKAIDVFYAIGPNSFERQFQRLLRSRAGRCLLAARPSLAGALGDRDTLERLPAGSLGRAYLAYLDRNGFETTGLLALNHRVAARWERDEGIPPLDPARAWFRDRSILVHDLFHVLTDYPTDDVGEATLLAFSQAQLPGRAQLLLLAGATQALVRARGWRALGNVVAAWRRGRRATWLPAQPWEQLLALPLDTVRTLVGVSDALEAHPRGVPSGTVAPRSSHA
jgi:ubiquinone biosynthesis protein COQ4